ncbi:MAG: hypothetical protein AB1515_10575 [Nitrospirota bacterium]
MVEAGTTLPRVLILGYGRLGRAFCRRYHDAYQIRGIKRTASPVSPCESVLMPIQSEALRPHLAWADVIIFCPSSGSRGNTGRGDESGVADYRETYLGNMQFVLARLDGRPVRVILIGSTGVYPRQSGSWDEARPIVMDNDRQRVLWETEQALARSGAPYVILRCGGLYGEERDNFGWVRRRTELVSSELTDEPLALVHQDDVCGVIDAVIRRGAVNDIFNVRDDSALSRKRLFGRIAARAGIPIAHDGAPAATDRSIPNDKVKRRLGYRFSAQSILDYLEA